MVSSQSSQFRAVYEERLIEFLIDRRPWGEIALRHRAWQAGGHVHVSRQRYWVFWWGSCIPLSSHRADLVPLTFALLSLGGLPLVLICVLFCHRQDLSFLSFFFSATAGGRLHTFFRRKRLTFSESYMIHDT